MVCDVAGAEKKVQLQKGKIDRRRFNRDARCLLCRILPRLTSDCSDPGRKEGIKNQLNSAPVQQTPTPHGTTRLPSLESHADINHHLVQEICCSQAIYCCSCISRARDLYNTIECTSQPKCLYSITSAITTAHPDLTTNFTNNDNKIDTAIITPRNPAGQKHHPSSLRQISHPIFSTPKHFTATNTLPLHLLQRNPLGPHCLRSHSPRPMARQPQHLDFYPRQSDRRNTLPHPARLLHSSNPQR